MKWLGIALIYISFFSLIGFAVCVTESGIPLLMLFLMPSLSIVDSDKKNKTESAV